MNFELIAFVVIALVALPLTGRFVLAPVRQSHRRVQLPRRFVLSDFVSLLALLQIGLGIVVALVPSDYEALWLLLALVGAAMLAVWGAAVSTLSKAGVAHAGRRSAFALFVLPGCLVAMVGTVSLAAIVIPSIRGTFALLNPWSPMVRLFVFLAIATIVWLIFVCALRLVCRWVFWDERFEKGSSKE